MKRKARTDSDQTCEKRTLEVYKMIAKLVRENDRAAKLSASLSKREQQAVELRGKGLLEKEIADQMHVSTSSVKTYICRARKNAEKNG